MKSILSQLDTDDAVLLMYAAGELSAHDRAQVEQRLKDDPALRTEFEALQSALANVDGRLQGDCPIDELSVERAIRRTTSAIRNATQRPRGVADVEPWRLPTWMYPAAAAAVLLLGFSIYLANVPPGIEPAIGVLRTSPGGDNAADLIAMLDVRPASHDLVSADETAAALVATFDDTDEVLTDALNGEGFAGALAELGEIRRLAESGNPAASLLQ